MSLFSKDFNVHVRTHIHTRTHTYTHVHTHTHTHTHTLMSICCSLRSTLKDLMMLKGVKMSYMPFFIKVCPWLDACLAPLPSAVCSPFPSNTSCPPASTQAVSLSLQHYPVLNSHVSTDCSSITYKAGTPLVPHSVPHTAMCGLR